MAESVNDPVFFPAGSDRYCVLALNSQFWSISTLDTFPYNEHREFETTVLSKADNFDERYPAWNVKIDTRYYEKNKTTGEIRNFSRHVETFIAAGWRGNMRELRDTNGSYIGATDGAIINGREDRIYPYIANKMNSTHPTLWAYAWSHGREGKLRFSVGDGLCYLPDGTTTPPLALQVPERVPKYLGNASPPPPPPKDMDCCDCNTIATIVENQAVQQIRAQEQLIEQLKDHIDKRVLEIIHQDLEHLRALNFEDFLKAIIKRLNEVESNLWNGLVK